MKTLKLNDREFQLIEIPDDKKRRSLGSFCSDEDVAFQLCKLGLRGPETAKPFLNFHSKSRFNGGVIYNVQLPYDCDMIGKLSDVLLDDDLLKSLVPEKVMGYGFRNFTHPDYNGGVSPFDVWLPYSCKTELESFHTFLKLNQVDLTQEYILVEKQVKTLVDSK